MSGLTLNIVNSKSLEKQLKVVETRINELQTEIRDLEKIKTACQVLLGAPAEFPVPVTEGTQVEAASAKPPKKKSEKKTDTEMAEGASATDFAPPSEQDAEPAGAESMS